eukprot:9046471-Alexandrium_andersonii.AAC.1
MCALRVLRSGLRRSPLRTCLGAWPRDTGRARLRGVETERQTDRPTDRQTERQPDRQTDR